MLRRSTYIVSSRLGERRVRDDLAARGSLGHEVTTIAGLASRLAGGFARPISGIEVREALQEPPVEKLTSLRELADMPGFARAAAHSLSAAWHAGISLSARAAEGGRWAELAALEQHVEAALQGGALLPHQLVELAHRQVGSSPKLLGPITLERVDDLPPLYRGLLADLAGQVPVEWRGMLPRPPAWLPDAVTWSAPTTHTPVAMIVSCADPEHEALEALRWVHALLSSGRKPEEVALGAVDVGSFDDTVLDLAKSAGLPLHAAHGVAVLATPTGQLLAALADALARGPSQQRVRRVAAAARGARVGPLAVLPETWSDELHRDAGLTSLSQWRRALGKLAQREPQQAQILERLVADLALGLPAATRTGERWLQGDALALWRRALTEGPATVLEQSLARLRVDDGIDSATAVVWGQAETLVSWPRAHTRLLGLTARGWPRRGSDEDPLLPQRLRPGLLLQERSVARQDTDNFHALVSGTSAQLVASWPRRGADGRKQAKSPLLATLHAAQVASSPKAGTHHALSEADRRAAARPAELEADQRLQRARRAYRSARQPELTENDGLVRPRHPAVEAALARPHSATSLKTLLLNPHGFVAKYALGWQRPDQQSEALALDPASLGTLLHEVLETAVGHLAVAGGSSVDAAVARARQEVSAVWEAERPVPPAVLWRATLETVEEWACWALSYEQGLDFGQESYAELRFGYATWAEREGGKPWSTRTEVLLPGTDLRVRGVIDRLDLDRVNLRVRVMDYKSGSALKSAVGLAGGDELQRPLYTLAVRQLLGPEWSVEALLVYPRQRTSLPLANPDSVVQDLAEAIMLAVESLRAAGGREPASRQRGRRARPRFALRRLAPRLPRVRGGGLPRHEVG